ncbi:hypothetical protein [uncultured Herbaspirillum sp.]|uniref:hypothetical protein n=1 Tax=uncultured Herbaspirillum sp. TaxID=160236 RepID=UPI00258BA0FD|nr:hypothetical protein [uncultured Herbaspirillum sp.]
MRPTDFLGIPHDASAKALASLEEAFGTDWLSNEGGQHKLQRLWQRTDSLSTIELVSLGDAILLLNAIDSVWMAKRISDIKSSAIVSHGHLFEILSIGMLARGGMQVRPTRGNAPGVDAVVSFPDGYEVRFSMKNHDISDHEHFFRSRCFKTRTAAQSALKNISNSAQILIETKECLTEPDWLRVDAFIAKIQAISAQPLKAEIINKKVGFSISKLPAISNHGTLLTCSPRLVR